MKQLKKSLCLVGALNFSLLAFAAPTEVKVGILISQTGGMADIGAEGQNGFALAEKNLKAKLDNEHYKVKFVYADTRSTPESAATAVNKLIKSDNVDVIIGDLTSTDTLAAAPIAQTAGIPLLSPSSTSDKVTMVGDHISRACYIDSFQGIAMANFAVDNLKAKTAVLLVDTDMDHSRDVSKVFGDIFSKRGGKVVETINFSGTHDTSLLSQLTQIRKINPDVVYAPAYYSVMGTVFKQAKELQIKSQFLGTDAWDSPQLFKLAQGATEGALLTDPFSYQNPAPMVQKFRTEFKAAYHTEPSSYGALAYDSIYVLDNALSRLKWPVEKKNLAKEINNAIVSTKNVEGVTGDITLDKNRNVQKPSVVILKLTKTGYDFYSTYVPKS